MALKLSGKKWSGREVKESKGSISEIRDEIPHFEREPFAIKDGGQNKYLDRIVRKPLNSDSEYIYGRVHIPVTIVSKDYRLIQHRDVFNKLVDALDQFVTDLQSIEVTLEITEYGERMWVHFALANYKLNEGDKYPIVLVVSSLNSVDRTTPLNIKLSWYEPHSKIQIPYGMMSGFWQEVNLKKRHLRKKKHLESSDSEGIEELSKEIEQFLTDNLDHLAQERSQYIEWRKAKISREQLINWIDEIVEDLWTLEAAERVKSIAIQGYEVPYDFAPAKNAFDVSQVLGWIASQQETIDQQLRWLMDIPDLMEDLLKQNPRPAS